MITDFNKYKDCSPEDTIEKAKKIIADLGIEIEETFINLDYDTYSVRILGFINGKPFHRTYGKGTTKEFCLASGYMEFLERLQCVIPAIEEIRTGRFNVTYPFKFYPGEVLISYEEYMAQNNDISKSINGNVVYEKDGKIRCLPMKNLINGEMGYYPLCNMVGSNGFAAGNSLEESVVQGISEIVERYSRENIILKKLSPPIITDDIVKEFPYIEHIVNKIKENDEVELILQDCSVSGIPVVSASIIDKNSKCLANVYGCFPVYKIAFERSLTEMFQCYSIDSSTWRGYTEFEFSHKYDFDDINNKVKNLYDILDKNLGLLPIPCLNKEEFSYEIDRKLIHAREDYNNKQLFDFYVDFFRENKIDVFCYETSFIGINSCCVLIPQMEILGTQMFDMKNYEKNRSMIKTMSKGVHNLNNEEISEVCEFLKEHKFLGKFDHLFLKKLKETPLTKKHDYNYLYGCLYFLNNDYPNAIKLMGKYLKKNSYYNNPLINKENRMTFNLARAFYDYLLYKQDGLTEDEIKNIFSIYYYGDTYDIILDLYHKKINILDVFFKDIYDEEEYKARMEIYKKIYDMKLKYYLQVNK